MAIRDTTSRYGYISMANHWVSAGLMILTILLGWIMEDIGGKATEAQLTELHISFGLIILIITILRLGWRKSGQTPTTSIKMPDWQKTAAKFMKIGLYATLIGLPITGWIMTNADGYSVSVFRLIDMPSMVAKNHGLEDIMEEIHEFLVNTFIFLCGFHILATLKHHYLDKDDVLNRMLPEK